MTATPQQDAGHQPRPPADKGGTRRLHWAVSGITFVVGFVFGIIAVGLLSLTKPEFGAGPGPGGITPGSTLVPSPGGSVPVVAEARVNAGCLAVINDAQDTYIVLTGLDEAVTDVDLQRLDDSVRRLQPIEARLGRDLQNCEVDTGVTTGGPGEAPSTTSPTPVPTASPTR
jgi:hypothetical protein